MAQIIVVEDEPALRVDVTEVLEDAGYEVRGAANGEDGLSLILAEPPDLVICDRRMPVMSGDTMLATLRRERPDLNRLPFIFLSALTDVQDRRMVSDLAPTIYLGKPMDHRDLLRLVRDIISTSAGQA